MDATPVTATTSSLTSPLQNPVGIDGLSPILYALSTSGLGEFLSLMGILSFLGAVWSVYAIIAYLACIGMLGLYVFASIRYNELEALHDERIAAMERAYAEMYRGAPRNSRLQDVLTHIESDRPNDWKLAIIEADIILDDVLKQCGYVGNSLGERLRTITPSQLSSIDDAWEAHKVRNRIAHDGADFVLTKRMAEQTIAQYRRVFSEFGIS